MSEEPQFRRSRPSRVRPRGGKRQHPSRGSLVQVRFLDHVLGTDLARAQAARSDPAVTKLWAVPVRARRPAGLYEEAWRLANRIGWAKTYDAEYVALALLSRCQLLTVDARMGITVGSLVEVIGPNDLSGFN